MKDLKIEHKNQCVMQVSQDRTVDEYLKDKPLIFNVNIQYVYYLGRHHGDCVLHVYNN